MRADKFSWKKCEWKITSCDSLHTTKCKCDRSKCDVAFDHWRCHSVCVQSQIHPHLSSDEQGREDPCEKVGHKPLSVGTSTRYLIFYLWCLIACFPLLVFTRCFQQIRRGWRAPWHQRTSLKERSDRLRWDFQHKRYAIIHLDLCNESPQFVLNLLDDGITHGFALFLKLILRVHSMTPWSPMCSLRLPSGPSCCISALGLRSTRSSRLSESVSTVPHPIIYGWKTILPSKRISVLRVSNKKLMIHFSVC